MATYTKRLFAAGLIAGLYALPAYSLEFEGFGSIGYHQHDSEGVHAEKSSEYPEGFTLGGFDMYAFQQIGDDTSAFAEFIIGDFEEVIEMERLWIKRSFSSAFEFKAGLIESPLGYWNRTYHHGGQLLQDTITRPFFLRYEDRKEAIFPMVSVGLEVAGGADMRAGRLDYTMILANGMSLDTSGEAGSSRIQINAMGDPGEDKLVILRTAWSFSGLPLQIGLFGMNNPVTESGTGGKVESGSRLVSQAVLGADFHFTTRGLETIGEYYRINNSDAAGVAGSSSANAWYVQFGYQLTERLKPLYRYSDLDLEKEDPYFRYLDINGQAQHVIGLRYDVDESNAVKLEYSRMNVEGGYKSHAQLQWAFIMF